MNTRISPIAVLTCLLAGCGTNPIERGLTGAGLGAGAGATFGAIAGGPIGGAALLGAAAGGLTGMLTSKQQFNIGDPPWRRVAGTAEPNQSGPTIAWMQTRLNALGYGAGRSDGQVGPHTRAAIRAYQRDHGLLVDGVPSRQLADSM